MKAEELMRFDWVHLTDDDTPRQVDWIRSGEVGLFWGQTVTPPYLEPIPLTAEIFEKNGFERRKLDGGAEEFVLADDYYDITIEDWSDSIWVVRYDCTEMSTPYEQAVCSYVHQLQHFFRSSASDELADNFKV